MGVCFDDIGYHIEHVPLESVECPGDDEIITRRAVLYFLNEPPDADERFT